MSGQINASNQPDEIRQDDEGVPTAEKKTTTTTEKQAYIASIRALAGDGWSDDEIGVFYGISKQAIQKARKKYIIDAARARGKRGADKTPRGHHLLQSGDPCPTYLFGVWPGTPEWPNDADGKPLFFVGWDSCPLGKHLLEQLGGISKVDVDRDNKTRIIEIISGSREVAAAKGRCHIEWRPKLAAMLVDDELHRVTMECLADDESRRGKRDTSSLSRIPGAKVSGHGQRRSA